jgi:hypothetical protein
MTTTAEGVGEDIREGAEEGEVGWGGEVTEGDGGAGVASLQHLRGRLYGSGT